MFKTVRNWFHKLGPESRRRSRVSVHHEAFIQINEVLTPVVTTDLSMNGAKCTGADNFQAGQKCSLIIPLGEGLRIVVEGEIVRTEERGPAIRFTEMDPASFTHLRRLVELNARDADTIEDELRGRK